MIKQKYQICPKDAENLTELFDFMNYDTLPLQFENKKCWNDFRVVTKEFNTSKNNFYKNQKKELKKSIEMKKALIIEVQKIIEENKIAENSSRVKAIQEEWKKIGYLPRKISNSLWDEFRPLINRFYDILKSGAINLSKEEQKTYDNKTKFIDKLKFNNNNIKIISNFNAECTENNKLIIKSLKKQMANRVRWTESINTLAKLGINQIIEIGPGKVLSGLIKRISTNFDIQSINTINDLDNNL